MAKRAKPLIAEHNLTDRDLDRIVGMAWEDRTSFDAIERQFGLKEADVIVLMREYMHLLPSLGSDE